MECLFGITGKDYVLLASDTMAAKSITVMKSTEDKARVLTPHTVMLYAGEPGDALQFSEYIQANVRLYGIRNGIELSPKQVAKYTRRELADSLRSRNAYQVNLILGGFDSQSSEPHLYWIDYFAAMTPVPFAAQGYGAFYCLSLMDRYHQPDFTFEEGLGLMKKCIEELRRRFILNLADFKVRVVDKDGVREITL